MTMTQPLHTPPGPSRWATPVSLVKLARDRLGLMTEAASRYGDAVLMPLGPKTLYFFNHPDHAKHVLADNAANYHKGIGLVHARRALGDGLLTSEGELWRKQRKVIQPAFQQRVLSSQAGAIGEEAVSLVHRLRARATDGPVDLIDELAELTLGVLGRTLLDTDLSAYGSIRGSLEAVQDQAMFELTTLSAVPTWIPLATQLRFRRARRDLQRIVERMVASRLSRGTDGNDVLSRLIVSARDESDPGVGDQRLRDELVTLLLAGHETTASTLSWTFHLIDENPWAWEGLHEEAVRVLGDRLPDFEDLHQLRYTSMVLEEAMRLYPPVWILPRLSLAPDEIGGYAVPAGADVLVCPYTLHRHPAFWPEPERFDPQRFAPDRANDRPRYAYIPFGAGPRFCVGNNLGMMEAALVLAVVCRELRLAKVPGRAVVPEPMLSLRVRGGLPVTVRDATAG